MFLSFMEFVQDRARLGYDNKRIQFWLFTACECFVLFCFVLPSVCLIATGLVRSGFYLSANDFSAAACYYALYYYCLCVGHFSLFLHILWEGGGGVFGPSSFHSSIQA